MEVRYSSTFKSIKISSKPDAILIREDDRDMVIWEKVLPLNAVPIVHFLHGFPFGSISLKYLLRFIKECCPTAVCPEPDLLLLDGNGINHLAR